MSRCQGTYKYINLYNELIVNKPKIAKVSSTRKLCLLPGNEQGHANFRKTELWLPFRRTENIWWSQIAFIIQTLDGFTYVLGGGRRTL